MPHYPSVFASPPASLSPYRSSCYPFVPSSAATAALAGLLSVRRAVPIDLVHLEDTAVTVRDREVRTERCAVSLSALQTEAAVTSEGTRTTSVTSLAVASPDLVECDPPVGVRTMQAARKCDDVYDLRSR